MLTADNLTLAYGRKTVVHGVSLSLETPASADSPRDTTDARGGVALIGESGSGKTTIARALLGLVKPSTGTVRFRGQDIHRLPRADRADYRSHVQPVFQDGSEALNPRMTIGASLREALRLRKDEGPSVEALLKAVGLNPELVARHPHQLSGGQRQRVVIARALAVDPTLLVLDEPTSALDVTVQARILDLLAHLRTEAGLHYLLITHNLAVVTRLCDTVHVLFAGKVVESGPAAEVLAAPAHPYTVALREAVPRLNTPDGATNITTSRSERPDTQAASSGCAFRHRCPLAFDRCTTDTPLLRATAGDRSIACHAADEQR
jgi:peptide/nickel transport system ATP-binding protein